MWRTRANPALLQLEQTVTTLLALAREERSTAWLSACASMPVLERIVVEQSPLLEGKTVEVTIDVAHDTELALPASVLHILLSNLVGNAFAHTTAGEVVIDVHDRRCASTSR